jgi:6-pyruvoyl tetrahydropterin synthase/QueD family protein
VVSLLFSWYGTLIEASHGLQWLVEEIVTVNHDMGRYTMADQQVMRKVKIEGGYLNFSAAHFITYGGKCERLHGHNYGVLVEIEGTLGDDKLVFDFTVLKHLSRDICRRLNHHFLLPLTNPHLVIHTFGDELEIRFEDRRYIFPRNDVVELPIDNSTAERIAEYICNELRKSLAEYDTSNLHTIMVGVAEAPTQMAYYQQSFQG